MDAQESGEDVENVAIFNFQLKCVLQPLAYDMGCHSTWKLVSIGVYPRLRYVDKVVESSMAVRRPTARTHVASPGLSPIEYVLDIIGRKLSNVFSANTGSSPARTACCLDHHSPRRHRLPTGINATKSECGSSVASPLLYIEFLLDNPLSVVRSSIPIRRKRKARKGRLIFTEFEERHLYGIRGN
ncbi:hypothetical protein Trydic_g1620 [Trypoxylus dichotomus]